MEATTKPGIRFANASCMGGQHPEPPLHDYSLLAWNPNHEKFGSTVFTEDQKASVADVVTEFAVNPNIGAIAEKFGTSELHVGQAIAYASKAELLK